jgi:hypothetical protein
MIQVPQSKLIAVNMCFVNQLLKMLLLWQAIDERTIIKDRRRPSSFFPTKNFKKMNEPWSQGDWILNRCLSPKITNKMAQTKIISSSTSKTL